jgi:hypothetical protein
MIIMSMVSRPILSIESWMAATAGYRVGYNSASHFSRDYKRMFGAPPLEDAEQLRAAPDGGGIWWARRDLRRRRRRLAGRGSRPCLSLPLPRSAEPASSQVLIPPQNKIPRA